MDDIKASVMSLRLGATSPGIKKATSTHSLNGTCNFHGALVYSEYVIAHGSDDLYHTMTIFTSLCFSFAAIPTPPANRKDSSNSGKNQTADDRYMMFRA